MKGSIAALAALAVGGCASFSPDGGFGAVRQAVMERSGKDVLWAKTDADRDTIAARVAELLATPLSADAAVQLALLNNKGLQAALFELGISEADLVQAGRLPNPRLSLMRARHDGDYKIEQALTFNIFSLATMPLAQEVGQRRFEQVQRRVAMDVLDLAAETRKAYYVALGTEESMRYLRQVMTVAEASAELARRMVRAGNWGALQQAREQGFYADAALGVARAEEARIASRERLTRLLGLWGAQAAFSLPARLPDLPKDAEELPEVEQAAMERRLDLQAVRLEAEALARNLGLARTTRFINVLEVGPARVLEGPRSAPWKNGYEVSFELPLFDWGSARVAKAEATYMQAVNRAAEAAVNARSEVREAYRTARVRYDVARHYRDEVVPLRKRIAEENQLRYNGMLIGVFELLADARSQVASVNGYIEALRDYWVAKAGLDSALVGKPRPAAPLAAMSQPGGEAAAGH